MKPTSKKDWYIVLCENSKETTIVKNKTCNRNEKSWFDYKYVVKSKQHFPSEMLWDHIPDSADHLPVISFEEWQNLPDEPNNVYSNYEFNSESKIIGYKLINEEYKEASKSIINWDSDFEVLLYNGSWCSESAEAIGKLEKSGVLSLWFEPVYDESITLKSGKVLTASEIEEVKEILKNK